MIVAVMVLLFIIIFFIDLSHEVDIMRAAGTLRTRFLKYNAIVRKVCINAPYLLDFYRCSPSVSVK